MSDFFEILFLRDYGTRITAAGVGLLGLAGGLIGTFLLLRRRALLGDALAHATYPGICVAFMLAYAFTGTGKSLPWLLAGAAIAGLLGVFCMLAIRHTSKIKEDAALGLVLGCFFGLGVVLKGFLQSGDFGDASGIKGFLEGAPAALLRRDTYLIAGVLTAVVAATLLLYKELRLLCFDAGYARSQGWSVLLLDVVLMTLVALVVIVGLQAVGLVLMIAMLVIPPAAARFWSRRLNWLCLIAAGIGLLSGYLGTVVSTAYANWPAGASIVLSAAAVFVVSLLFGSERGLIVRAVRRMKFDRQIEDDNLLRSIYEISEQRGARSASLDELFSHRGWTRRRLGRIVRRGERESLVHRDGQQIQLTGAGLLDAKRIVRNHRLWEQYMLQHADVAASHVDRGADLIEHVLGEELVRQLEASVFGERKGAAS